MFWTDKYWLWALWLLPILAGLFRRAAVSAERKRELFAEPPMSQRLAPTRGGARQSLRALFVLAGVALMLVAAAGPYGAGELVRVERSGADIQILLDISRSMLSDDVKPNRLESAKLDINDLLERVRGDRVGLIAFAGRPIVKIPLTRDCEFFREALRTLSVDDAPRGGTAIGEAIRLALRSVDKESTRDRAILLITDGEDHESDPLEAADQAAAMGVKIYTVALGDAEEGGRIPLYNNRGEQTGYQKYKGKEIRTKADRELLRQIAEKTGGEFLDMGKTPTDLGAFYRKSIRLNRSGSGEEDRRVRKEKYQPFLLAGILLLGFGCGISPWRTERKTAAALLLAALTLCLPGGFAAAETASDEDVDFFAESADGQETEQEPAAEPSSEADAQAETPPTFERELDPNLTAEELYNTACDLAARGEADHAELCLRRGLDAVGPRKKSLRARIRYNLGLLQAGRLEAEAENVFAEPDKETAESTPSPDAAAEGGEKTAPKDIVAAYRRAAEKRTAAFDQLLTDTQKTAATLRDAAADGGGKLRADALRDSDLLLSWGEGKSRAFSAGERRRRGELFSPTDQLRWLDEELTRLFEDSVSAKEPCSAEEWQKIYKRGESLAERKADLEEILESGTLRDDENPALSDARIASAESGLTALTDAADRFSAGEESAVKKVRESIAELDRAALTYADYPAVVSDAVARQGETVKRLAASGQTESAEDAEAESSPVTQEGIAARDDAIRRRLERMTDDAQREFADRPYNEEEENRAVPEAETDPAEAEGTEEGKGGEIDFFTPDTDDETGHTPAAPPAEPQESLSPEERIRRSMNLALELAPEITREEDALAALPAESFRADASRHEEAILELLRRIAEPLQDPNQQNQQDQNQNQQNQDQQNQDQNQQNQDQGDQSQNQPNGGDQNKDSQENPQNQNREGQNPQDQNQQDQNEQSQNDRDQGNQDQAPQTGNQKENRGAMTPEDEEARQREEKAEAMMRKIDDRQRQVEALRRQRNRLFQRYEKPEKDW
ncbi:MAG: VWA domain-containing protein [Thermoguttaceae bacterium]|nr:VWA domain-containing protein [Thermoguttaceae bacterium]